MIFSIYDPAHQVPQSIYLSHAITEFPSLQAAQLDLCLNLKAQGLQIEDQQAMVVPFQIELMDFLKFEWKDHQFFINGQYIDHDSHDTFEVWLLSKNNIRLLRRLWIDLERECWRDSKRGRAKFVTLKLLLKEAAE